MRVAGAPCGNKGKYIQWLDYRFVHQMCVCQVLDAAAWIPWCRVLLPGSLKYIFIYI